MVHDPLSPSEALRTKSGITLGIISVFILLYSLIITAQILLGGFLTLFLTLGVYGFYRLFAVLDAVADAQQRIATVREQESKINDENAVSTQTQTQDKTTYDLVDDNE